MSNLFDSFLQIAGARSFSDFLKGDKASSKRLRRSKKNTRRRSLRKTLTQRTSRRSQYRKPRKSSRKTSRRTSRKTLRRTSRRSTNNTIRLRNLSKRKMVGKPGKYQCINGCKGKANRGYFKGTEPSPKGLGYCAHCTTLNVIMKGKDGKLWENKKFSKGKRWVKK